MSLFEKSSFEGHLTLMAHFASDQEHRRRRAAVKARQTVTAAVLQGDLASVAGGGESAVQRNLENDQEEPAVRLPATTQFRLHLSATLTSHCRAGPMPPVLTRHLKKKKKGPQGRRHPKEKKNACLFTYLCIHTELQSFHVTCDERNVL